MDQQCSHAPSPPPQLPLWFNIMPKKFHPYMELGRYESAMGMWLTYLPCTWSIALASNPGCLPDPRLLVLFAAMAWLMCGAGCTINDILDHDIDAKVGRTKGRPIARGSVSVRNALAFFGLQLSLALLLISRLNSQAIFIAISSIGLVCLYPLFKRFTYFPQVMLGLTLNMGAIIGHCAVDVFDLTKCLPIYLVAAFQTVIYDSVYAFQDIEYDKRVGVKSMPVLLGGSSKWWLYSTAVGMSAWLAVAGLTSGAGSVYFVGALLVMLFVFYMLWKTNLADPKSCIAYFNSNRDVGLGIFAAIVLDRLLLPTV